MGAFASPAVPAMVILGIVLLAVAAVAVTVGVERRENRTRTARVERLLVQCNLRAVMSQAKGTLPVRPRTVRPSFAGRRPAFAASRPPLGAFARH